MRPALHYPSDHSPRAAEHETSLTLSVGPFASGFSGSRTRDQPYIIRRTIRLGLLGQQNMRPKQKKTQVQTHMVKRDHLDNATGDLGRALTTFSLRLYQTLSKRDPRPNLVIAPISIALTLSHLLLGARGETQDAMVKTLYEGLKDVECVHEAIRNLTKSDSFLSASEIFYAPDISLNAGFLQQSLQFMGARGQPLGPDPEQNLRIINKWVSEKTGHHIPNLLQEQPMDLQLLLANAVYYQGKWQSRFDPALTRKDLFFRPLSNPVKVMMMNSHKYPLQSVTDAHLQAQVARFPLSHNFSLLLLVPVSHAPDALGQMEKRLTQEVVDILVKRLQNSAPRATSVTLPRLQLDSDHGLTEALSMLDLHTLISSPDLCALSSHPDLAVSDVRHRAVLEITEDGVTAAAASSVSLARTLAVFAVRRPFIFILTTDRTGVPLLLGRVTDPSQ
ncbi:LOW QUALITY PROTEIN: plasma protease C1 inhibitor [Ascaphus truei]|uniref:LOW QUALITY PROTEIN: plasma protease C1 inhibitor n=1 Tax=Ascaphus truei TaxID=8439 RepID=UPI003F59CB5D